MTELINKSLLDGLFAQAKDSPRQRQNYDMRTSGDDRSQRMLNALLPGTEVAIHRHTRSTESVICLCGRLDEIIFDNNGIEIERISLCPAEGRHGCQIPAGAWHTVEVHEPSVIFEAKDGAFGSDGSETLDDYKKRIADAKSNTPEASVENNAPNSTNGRTSQPFSNSLGDLKRNIEYLIGMERLSGSMDTISPLYISRMLNVPLAEVEQALKEINILK
ncbi:MAG: WbuC family cupin fold metalloprotein [Segatella copri]